MLWERIADLALEVSDYSLEPLASTTPVGWTRHATVVRLRGGAHDGVGEDVTYEDADQLAFQRDGGAFRLAGHWTLASFSRRLDELALFSTAPTRTTNWLFRRWAFESAALDLALRQNDTSLETALGREAAPVKFVVSLGLGEPPSIAPLERVLELYPELGFKVDFAESWTEDTVAQLARLGDRIAAVDLKGHYHGSFQGPRPDAALYRAIAEQLERAWIEDPAWDGPAWQALEPYRDRVTWDNVLHSLADLVVLPSEPMCVNIKPSRFGLLSELLRTYEYCEARGIAMYGGGQFELGPGRAQIQHLASLFHPDASNDVAPTGFNRDRLEPGLPSSPLELHEAGFGRRLSL